MEANNTSNDDLEESSDQQYKWNMFKCPLYFEKDNFLSLSKFPFPRIMIIKKKNCFIASLKMKTCKFTNSTKHRLKALIFDPLYPYKFFWQDLIIVV